MAWSWSLCAILVAAFVVFIPSLYAAPVEDEVKNLPGVTTKPTFKIYSGYLNATGDKILHYVFVESSHNPSSDPVVMWMNGGPGCSSMDGLLTEHGPFLVNDDGITLSKNKYSWNNEANMLYLEAPAGVGFSYSETGNYTTNDDLVSLDNFIAVKDFFAKFPEFKSNQFFITGESYAGIYVPTLSVRVLADTSINFQGYAVGNGITDFKWNDNSVVYFGYYHGLLSAYQWTQLMEKCCPGHHSGPCDFEGNTDKACQSEFASAISIIYAPSNNMYNLYAPCASSGSTGWQKNGRYVYSDIPYLFMNQKFVSVERQSLRMVYGESLKVSIPCIDSTSLENYLNLPAVRSALHIPSKIQAFEICSDIVGAKYSTVYQNVKQFYSTVLSAKKRILVYNGDFDMACNFIGCEWFVDTLGLQKSESRKQWFYVDPATSSKQVAGYVDTYTAGLNFVTIRGAGHMVPTDKPRPAYDMFIRFIHNLPY